MKTKGLKPKTKSSHLIIFVFLHSFLR